MQAILEIFDYTIAFLVIVLLFVFFRKTLRGEKIKFSRFSLAMMYISFCDMIIDGLQGEIVSFIVSGLLCLYWIYAYKKDRQHEITI